MQQQEQVIELGARRKQDQLRLHEPSSAPQAHEETLSPSEAADEVLESGLGMVLDALGPGFAGIALAHDGPGLVMRAAAGCDPKPLQWLRLTPGELAEGTPAGDGSTHLWTGKNRVNLAISRMAAQNRACLAYAFGQRVPTSLLSVPIASDDAYLGRLLILGLDGCRDLEERDVRTVKAAARLTAVAARRITLLDADNNCRSTEEANRWQIEVSEALSHQMRTPLASIRGYATALLLQGSQYDQDTRQEFLSIIDEETEKLSNLISDLLESSTMEAGLLELQKQPVLLERLAQEVMRKVAKRSAQHKFLVSFPPRFPVVHADPARLEQVLLNLTDNAVKYSPDGGLIVLQATVDQGEVTVSIADQGVGIAPVHLNRLFERFYRIRDSRLPAVKGTGLGLPIARAIVEAHGGRIWAESTAGRGSKFYFTLPCEEVEDDLW